MSEVTIFILLLGCFFGLCTIPAFILGAVVYNGYRMSSRHRKYFKKGYNQARLADLVKS